MPRRKEKYPSAAASAPPRKGEQNPFAAEARRLRRLERFRKTQQLFDRDRLMRRLKDARAQADSVENYLSSLNSAYRQAAGAEEKQKQLTELTNQSFRGRALTELLQQEPTSYKNLRETIR